jgi:hypothetical protein
VKDRRSTPRNSLRGRRSSSERPDGRVPWRRAGNLLVLFGLSIAPAPLLIAFAAAAVHGTSPFDESSGSGSVLWLLLLSVPLGSLLFLCGMLLRVIARRRD